MLHEILEHSQKNQSLIGINLYGNNGFWCGIVEDFNDEFVQIRHYTKYGDPDGTVIEKIADIERIDLNDKYLKTLRYIIENKESLKNSVLKSRVFDELHYDNWQFISLKPYEKDKDVMIYLQINNNNYYHGFVEEIDDYYLKFDSIDDDGGSEGISLFKLEDVNTIKINGLESRRRLLAYNFNKTNIT